MTSQNHSQCVICLCLYYSWDGTELSAVCNLSVCVLQDATELSSMAHCELSDIIPIKTIP
jgi:hypothetical protein